LRVNVSLSLTLDEIAALAPSDRDDYVEALRTYALPILAELRDEAWREYEQLEDEP
jgi:hypothetical protein